MRIIATILIVFAFVACRTAQPSVTKTTEVKEVSNDSNATAIKDSSSLVYVRETTPASNNKINTTVTIDSNGIVPFNITVTSGSDTLNLRGRGNQLFAESNCAKRERILLDRLRKLETEKSHKSSKKSNKKETEVVVSVIIHEVTPWWNWLGYGVLGSFIVLLLLSNIRNSFKI